MMQVLINVWLGHIHWRLLAKNSPPSLNELAPFNETNCSKCLFKWKLKLCNKVSFEKKNIVLKWFVVKPTSSMSCKDFLLGNKTKIHFHKERIQFSRTYLKRKNTHVVAWREEKRSKPKKKKKHSEKSKLCYKIRIQY